MNSRVYHYPNKAKSHSSNANEIDYHKKINALLEKGETEKAKNLYQQSDLYRHFRSVANGTGYYKIDLHGFSYGSAYVALTEFVNTAFDQGDDIASLNIEVIYGKGLHSKTCEDEGHPVKRATKNVINTLKSRYKISIKENEGNTGRASIRVARTAKLNKHVRASVNEEIFSQERATHLNRFSCLAVDQEVTLSTMQTKLIMRGKQRKRSKRKEAKNKHCSDIAVTQTMGFFAVDAMNKIASALMNGLGLH